MKRDVGEHRDLRAQDAEADRVGGDELAVPHDAWRTRAPPDAGTARAPSCSCGRRHQIDAAAAKFNTLRTANADCQLIAFVRTPVERAAGKAADDRAADIGRRGAAGFRGGPLLVNVGDRNREDARRDEPLHEAPEDQLRQRDGRRRRAPWRPPARTPTRRSSVATRIDPRAGRRPAPRARPRASAR